MSGSTLVIATYDRPAELGRALRSVLLQTRLPDEVIVVDDGDLPGFPLEDRFREAGIETRLLRKAMPGLVGSRIAGIEAASGDVILFIDDDVALFPDYVERVLAVYRDDRRAEIGGVGGLEANLLRPVTWRRRARRLAELLFGMTGFREGRVLPSGYCTEYGSTGRALTGLTDVDFLVGATSSYRASICRELVGFDVYRKIPDAIGEDKAFSFAVSRKHRLVVNPLALLYHYESPASRASQHERGRAGVLHQYCFFREQVRQHGYQWPLFWYALFGHLLTRSATALLFPDNGRRARVSGMWRATWQVVTRGVDDDG
jgi:glycosyltransferase involved in cell wall biosynthesis